MLSVKSFPEGQIQVCIKLCDHVEQFISSFSMSKVAADSKLPNKSVNRLPWTVYTKMVKQFPH